MIQNVLELVTSHVTTSKEQVATYLPQVVKKTCSGRNN